LGQIYLTEKQGAPEFTQDDEKIIQMLAAYAAAAIQNARMMEQMKERDVALTRRNLDMELLNGIASTLTSSLELNEILNKTLGLMMNYMKVESGEIFLLDEDKTTLRMVLHRGEAPEAFWIRNTFGIGEGFVGLVAMDRKPIVSHNIENDVRFQRDTVVKAGFHQIACIPLMSGENLMGVLSLATRHKGQFDERDLQLLTAVGNWAGLAIENARLHANVRRFAVLEERERIGMDLHDGIIQSIYGVGLSLENALHSVNDDPEKTKERVQHAIEGLNRSIRDLRAYILDLRPHQLGNDGLLNGLKRLATEFRANTFAEVQLTGSKKDVKDLPQSHSQALFHICQEALANTAKHAKAKKVQISLWSTKDRVLMEIHDDGKGFDMDKMNAAIGHGLANMKTRAQATRGDVDISSIVDAGTTILAWVPRYARE
jgi:signal transduction histidine kinase